MNVNNKIAANRRKHLPSHLRRHRRRRHRRGKTLLSAECTFGPEKGSNIFNLNSARTKRALQLKNLIKMGLVS